MSATKSTEPLMTRKGLLAHPGSLLVGLAGSVFVAYVFNFQNLKTFLDNYLGGLNQSVTSRGSQLTPILVFALPAAAVLLSCGILYILLSALTSGVMGSVKESRKKKAKALARSKQEAEALASGAKPVVAEPMVLVRPTRINMKDVGIIHIAAAKQ